MHLPFPVRLAVNVETLTLAEAMLQRVAADLKSDGENWDIEALDFRAPGITQVRLNGRLGATPKGVGFKGQAKIDANDPRALFAWLTDRADAQAVVAGPLRLSGGLTLSSEEIAVDALKAELDRMTIAGRFGYRWASEGRPARIDAALTAPEIDVDRVHALGKAVFDSTGFDWPREGQLSLKVARAQIAGIDAKQADVAMRIDANGVEIERFALADFGGATLAVKGRIDARGQAPRGAITLDLDARALDGAFRNDANTIALLAHAAFDQIGDTKLLTDCSRIAGFSLKEERRTTPDHLEFGTFAKTAINSSERPSEKYSLLGSPLVLTSGSTAIDFCGFGAVAASLCEACHVPAV